MSKKKSEAKDKKKTRQFLIRVEKSERDAFVQLCERLDTSAAREVRRFMREFVALNASSPEATTAEAETAPEGDEPVIAETAVVNQTPKDDMEPEQAGSDAPKPAPPKRRRKAD